MCRLQHSCFKSTTLYFLFLFITCGVKVPRVVSDALRYFAGSWGDQPPLVWVGIGRDEVLDST